MLNQQQLTDALAFQSYKAMQFENMAAQLEQHCKSLLEELQLLKKHNEEQQEILQNPEKTGELRDKIETLEEANQNLSSAFQHALKGLTDIAEEKRPSIEPWQVAVQALNLIPVWMKK